VDKILLEIYGLQSGSGQTQSGSFTLILQEKEGNRRMPMVIGMFEAQAIAIEIEKIQTNRPMTHDLFKSFAKELAFKVSEVIIYNLKEGVFFAKLVVTDSKGDHEIDARPSDAIAIALRFDAPIYSNEQVLSEAGIIFNDDAMEEASSEEIEEVKPAKPSKKGLESLNIEELNKILNEALANEDYERAAKIRDELGKRG
jgi:uncharacterized protein